MSKTIQLSLISVALISSLHAQNPYTLESIEITASQGTSLDKKDVTDSTTIITKESIEESRVTTLDEALHKLGNITMSQNGGAGKQTSMYLRGMDTKRLLVLVDGVRYNNPSAVGSTADFSQIMLYNVEQIEIIKGAQSGVWGSDASGGVINIITAKVKNGLHGELSSEYGSFNTSKISLGASYGAQTYDVSISGSYYKTGGFSAVEPNQSETQYGKRYDELDLERDAYLNKSLNVKLGYNITQDDRIEVDVKTIDSEVEFDSFSGIYGDSSIPNTLSSSRFYNLAFKHKDSLNDIKISYNLSTFDREMELASWSGEGTDIYKYLGSVNEIKIDDKITYMRDSFVRVGASYQKFEQKEITENTDKSYSAVSAFLTNYNKLELFSGLNTIITESLRYDKYDEVDNSFTGKIGAKQFIKDDFYISFNAGTGFNTPTLGQLFGQWGANPDLTPETSLTTDITVGNDTIWLTGFYNKITDLIEYDMNTYAYVQTSGTSKFQGLELGYEDYFLDILGVSAMYTYVKAENANKESLARRPEMQLDARVTYYVLNNLDLGLNAQYIGERYDSADKQGAQTGKYTVTNFITNFEFNKELSFYGKIDNITDEYYQSVDGYATAGRSYYIGLNAKY